MAIGDSLTTDAILGGRVRIRQPRKGYRFSIDAVLLARFMEIQRGARVLELGAGSGVISILISVLQQPKEVFAVEVQLELAALIAENAEANSLQNLKSICADVRDRRIAGLEAGSFDWVIANPPYRAARSGRESPDCGRRIGRGESMGTLRDFIGAAAKYCRFGGRVAVVFTAARTAELISSLKRRKLEPKRLRMVHPASSKPASLVLVEAARGGGVELKVEAPLIVHSAPGVYSDEVRSMLGI